MKEYTFTFSLSEYKEQLPFYSKNDMEDVELDVTYSVWKEDGCAKLLISEVKRDGVDIAAVLYALNAMTFIDELAAFYYEGEKIDIIFQNYPHLATNPTKEERYEQKRVLGQP
jgi:hypothetical protein